MYAGPVTEVCLFLRTLFDEDKQVYTTRNYTLTLAVIHKGFPDGSSMGFNRFITQLLRGMLNSRLPKVHLPPAGAFWRACAPLPSCGTNYYRRLAFSISQRSTPSVPPWHQPVVRDVQVCPQEPDADFYPGGCLHPKASSSLSCGRGQVLMPSQYLKVVPQKDRGPQDITKAIHFTLRTLLPVSKDTISRCLVDLIPHNSRWKPRNRFSWESQ